MKTLSSIKKDLEFNKGLSSLLEVLKNIAVSQYRALEQRIKPYEKFDSAVQGFFKFINSRRIDHPFLNPKNNKQAVIAVTSDGGFMGGLNRQVVNAALSELEKIPGRLIIIGERGKIYASEYGVPFTAFGGIKEEERYPQAIQLRDYIMTKLAEESIGHLKIVYPRPVTFTIQRVETLAFLPYTPAQDAVAAPNVPGEDDIILESTAGDILGYLVYLWIGHRLYEIFGLSKLAEFAARFVHLEESSQKLKEIDKKTQLEYFHVRHELIDRNMRELFSARLLFTSKH